MAARLEVNVEALNAVETVGNVVKHRRAPMVIPTESGYRLVYVPAVSGEAVANAYQRALVEYAKIIYSTANLTPPLTPWDERHEFVKFMDDAHLTNKLKAIVQSAQSAKSKSDVTYIISLKHDFEKTAITESLVADIGGFLFAKDELPVKRTSRFYCGYVLPVYDAIDVTAIEAQIHARHVPTETWRREKEQEKGGQQSDKAEERRAQAQMLYYVEVASGIYGLTLAIDLSGIGVTSLVKVEKALNFDERLRRVKVALAALQALFTGVGFGAKLTRFTPVKRVISAVATVTHPLPFMVHPPQVKGYVQETVNRLLKFRGYAKNSLKVELDSKAVVYGESVTATEQQVVTVAESLEDFFDTLAGTAIDLYTKYEKD
jgi:CRISPR-associated protein Csa2